MITLTNISQDKFNSIKDTLSKSKDVKSSTPTSDNSGAISTSLVDFTYKYDASTTELLLTITGKHGKANFASEGVIKSHIQDMLA